MDISVNFAARFDSTLTTMRISFTEQATLIDDDDDDDDATDQGDPRSKSVNYAGRFTEDMYNSTSFTS